MVNIAALHAHMPAHLALNCALLLRNARDAFQVDEDDQGELRSIARGLRAVAKAEVDFLPRGPFTLVRLAGRKMPPRIEAAWERLVGAAKRSGRAAEGRAAEGDVGLILGLKCPAADLVSGHSFTVKMVFTYGVGNGAWNFKQQMCASPGAFPRLWRELRSYEDVASEMGFDTVIMQVSKSMIKGRRALELGPYLKEA